MSSFLDSLFGTTNVSGAGAKFSDGLGNLYGSAAEANKMQADFSMDDVVIPVNNTGSTGGFMDFLGSNSMKGLGTLTGIGTDIWGISNTLKAQKQAKKQWEAENSRANEIMAMNREKYDTYKADKSRLNSQYA